MRMTDSQAPLEWVPDILPGFEQATLQGLLDDTGPIDVVIVRRLGPSDRRKAVLYIHGFIDYFFQEHLANFYLDQGLQFYAVDLRRHGRSLRTGQLPNFTASIDDYFADLDAAVEIIREQEKMDFLLLNGHSTGGLLSALYCQRGQHRKLIDALFLNSPFFDMNIPAWQANAVEPLLAFLGRFLPTLRYPGISPIYAQSIHAAHHGQWRFNTDWKPIEGFPVYAGWFRAIHRAQDEIAKGLDIHCPCLVLHAEHSFRTTRWTEKALAADIVLNVDDIKRLAPGLGSQVEIHAIGNGMHDLVLSNETSRQKVWKFLGDWLQRHVV